MLYIPYMILCQADMMWNDVVWNSLKKSSKETARLPQCSMGSAFNCIIPYKFIMKRKTFRDRQNTVADAIWITSKHTETCFQFEPEASVPNFLKKKKRRKERKKSSNWKWMQLLLDSGGSEEFLWLVIWNRKKLDLLYTCQMSPPLLLQ